MLKRIQPVQKHETLIVLFHYEMSNLSKPKYKIHSFISSKVYLILIYLIIYHKPGCNSPLNHLSRVPILCGYSEMFAHVE
mgnify:CR=1 FL=1